VGELKKLGVTLHLILTDRREKVGDVPAVYFIRPTVENIQILARDMQRQLYDEFYINFTSSVPPELLDSLAEAVAQAEAQGVTIRVGSVTDQLADFISESPRLVSLGHANSYVTLFGPLTPDAERERYVASVVEGLFCVCATLGAAPIIRAPPSGSPASFVAELLAERLRSAIAATPRLFSAPDHGAGVSLKPPVGTSLGTGGASDIASLGSSAASAARLHRPLFIIVDRQFDMATPLQHPTSFHALLADVMGLNRNRVTYRNDEGKMETVDIDMHEDFWTNNAGKTMDVVAENVAALISEYKRSLEEVQRITGKGASELTEMLSGNAGGAASLADLAQMEPTASMESVVDAVPKLVRKKKIMTTHTNLGGALTEQIRNRGLGELVAMEEAIANGERPDKNQLTKLVKQGKGSLADRTRLLLVAYLAPNSVVDNALFADLSQALTQQYEAKNKDAAANAFPSASAEVKVGSESKPESDPYDFDFNLPRALSYAKRLRADQSMAQVLGASRGSTGGAAAGAAAGASGEGGVLGSLAQLVIDHSANIYSTIKRAVSDANECPLVRLTSALMNNDKPVSGASGTNAVGTAGAPGVGETQSGADFLYLDPRLPRSSAASVSISHRQSGPFRQALVFVVGSGCLHEYYLLQELAHRRSNQATPGTGTPLPGPGFGQSCSIAYGCSELRSPNELLKQLSEL